MTTKTKGSSSSGSDPGRFYLVVILIVSFLAFYNTLQNDLTTWDDEKYITDNPLVQQTSAKNIKSIITAPYFNNYSPLHLLFIMAEHKMFGIKAQGYHLFSILLHCVNGLLVFLFLFGLCKDRHRAFLAALLFALHPLRTESVAWASEQKDLLFAFFYLLGLISYLRWQQTRIQRNYLITMLWFVLGLFAKSAAITFPLVLLLIDYYINGSFRWKDIKAKAPFLALSFIMGIITIYAQKEEALVENPYLPLMERLPVACYALAKYALNTLLPFDLCAFYPYPSRVSGHLPYWYWLFLIPVAFVTWYVIKNFRKNVAIVFCILFFVCTNLLTLQLIPVGSALMADRYTYLPSAGLSMLIILLGEKLLQRLSVSGKSGAYIVIVLTLLLTYVTVQQNKIWKSSMSLYDHILAKYPDQAVFYNNRGAIKVEQKDLSGGLEDYNLAVRYAPGYYLSYYNLGNYYKEQKQYAIALDNYNRSIALKPTPKGYLNRGVLYAIQKNYEAAIPDFNKAIEMNGNYALAYKNRGLAFIYTNRQSEGCSDLLRASDLGNEGAQTYYKKHCLGL